MEDRKTSAEFGYRTVCAVTIMQLNELSGQTVAVMTHAEQHGRKRIGSFVS
jgi:hypothetical protein